jgi:nitrate/nitrite transporter NarK
MVVWFRDKQVTLALGVTGGAAFSAGAAVALYVWLYVQRVSSWHTSMILAGVFELLVLVMTLAAFEVPEGDRSLGGMQFDRFALWATLMNRDLWVYGVAMLGGYGAYFTTSQLFSEYVTTDRHFDPSSGGLLSALILLAGIPGSLLGGHCADRSRTCACSSSLPSSSSLHCWP